MISEMFIHAQVQRGEAEMAIRIAYAAHPLTHATRLHRKQGVYAPLRMVCAAKPTDHRPILTTYNQSRMTNHRG